MKQTIYAIGMLLLFVSVQVNAQKSETALLTSGAILSGIGSGVSNVNISAAALEKFSKDFSGAMNVEWVPVKEGFRAYFTADNITTAVDYTNKGKLYSVIRYGKALLTPEMARTLERRFNNPQIREVSEVKIADFAGKVYIFVFEDNVSMKTVQLMDGDLKVIQEIRK